MTVRHVLTGHAKAPNRMAVAPSGDWLASASHDGTARIWDIATGTTRLIMSGHTDAVLDVDVSADGLWLATVGGDRTLRLWSASTGESLATVHMQTVPVSVAIAPSRNAVYAGSARGLYRFDVAV